jgi:hypothetical protein
LSRHLFGGSPADYAMEKVGSSLLLRPEAVGTVWDSLTGGSQYTDLTDLTGTPVTTVTADEDGAVSFYGPDNIQFCYVDFGYGRRYGMTATDTGQLLAGFVAEGGQPGGWAQLDGSGKVPAAQLPADSQTATASKSAVITAPTGAVSYVIWRAPVACLVTAVHGYRVGGTGATINATMNGADLITTNLSLSTDSTWMSGATLQNTSVPAGAVLAVSVRSVTGTPTAVTVQIDVQGL